MADPRVDPAFPKAGRTIESPPGLPQGWEAVEKMYWTGKIAGQTYIRFQCPKHRSVLSVPSAIAMDAADRGLDPEAEKAKYFKLKQEVADQKDEERKKAGQMTGELKQQCVEAFEGRLGKLEAAVIPKMTGWSFKTKFLQVSGQTHVLYFNPEGKSFGTVVNVMAALGYRQLNGEEEAVIQLVTEARQAYIKEHGELPAFGFNPLRRTESGVSLGSAVASGNMEEVSAVEQRGVGGEDAEALQAVRAREKSKQKRRRTWLPSVEDYIESPSLVVVRAQSADALLLAGAPPEFAAPLDRIRALLMTRGFQKDVGLLAVFSREGADSGGLQDVSGLYYPMETNKEDRPLFQWVGLCEAAMAKVACKPCYVFWSTDHSRWQIGNMRSQIHKAFLQEDVADPVASSKAWRVLRDGWSDAQQPGSEGMPAEGAAEEEEP